RGPPTSTPFPYTTLFRSRCTIVQREVQRCSGMLQELDLVLSDPPWPISDRAAGVVARVLAQSLKPEARVVLGHPNRGSLPDQLRSEEHTSELQSREHFVC